MTSQKFSVIRGCLNCAICYAVTNFTRCLNEFSVSKQGYSIEELSGL